MCIFLVFNHLSHLLFAKINPYKKDYFMRTFPGNYLLTLHFDLSLLGCLSIIPVYLGEIFVFQARKYGCLMLMKTVSFFYLFIFFIMSGLFLVGNVNVSCVESQKKLVLPFSRTVHVSDYYFQWLFLSLSIIHG